MKNDSSNAYLADLLYPKLKLETNDILNSFPKRKLNDGAMVTRFAPSPTGFIHIGGLFTALINNRFAYQTGGIFILRIDDTDKNREVKNGISKIITAIEEYGVTPTEGVIGLNKQRGDYGPYIQSERLEIYHAFAKLLVRQGRAYPCFCTSQDLEELRNKQEARNLRTGYYGEWAKDRNEDLQSIKGKIKSGQNFVLRLRSYGNPENKISYQDLIRGKLTFPENDNDVILIKSDGYPTYHFAHVIDDHLMQTTHVIRADEWLSSMPLHLQLFTSFDWEPPMYAHISPIMKMDGFSKRKLSKRKDPEANVDFYKSKGYTKETLVEYLLNIINSNYEDWRRLNKKVDNSRFQIRFEKVNKSGALFDINKLNFIGKDQISYLHPKQLNEGILLWCKEQNRQLYKLLSKRKEFLNSILTIEKQDNGERKDFRCFSDIMKLCEIFLGEYFEKMDDSLVYVPCGKISVDLAIEILSAFIGTFNIKDNKDMWLEKIKRITNDYGFACDTKTYKKDIEEFRGQIGDVIMLLRTAITKKTATPDLYEIIQLLGEKITLDRLKKALVYLESNNHNIGSTFFTKSDNKKKISCVFGDYRTTSKLYVKEKLSLQVEEIYNRVSNGFSVSTCLRSEIYQISNSTIRPELDFLYAQGKTLLVRLLSVMSGLQSEIIGEREIFGQFRDNINNAYLLKRLDKESFEFMHQLLELSQEIRTQFGITNPDNYSTIGYRIINENLKKQSQPTLMVIGGGYMADSFMKSIKKEVYRLIWVNRSLDKIKKKSKDLFSSYKGQVIFKTLEESKELLPLVDAVFVAVKGKQNFFAESDILHLPESSIVVDVSYPSIFAESENRKIITIQNTDFSTWTKYKVDKKTIVCAQKRINELVDKL